MKYIIVLGDGMADEPIEALKTKLRCKRFPNRPSIGWRRTVAANARYGSCRIRSGQRNRQFVGTRLRRSESFRGRGSLEAASMGVKIEDGDVMRCNLITIEDGKIKPFGRTHLECGSRRTDRLPAKNSAARTSTSFREFHIGTC